MKSYFIHTILFLTLIHTPAYSKDKDEIITNEIKSQDKILFEACLKGDIVKVKELIENGMDLNAKDKEGNTIMMIANKYNKKRIIEYLKSISN